MTDTLDKPITAMKAIITTVPFGQIDDTPLRLLRESGLDFTINPLGRKLKPEEVADVIGDADIVIAGTEKIDKDVLDRCPNVKAICRVGIGLDSVDLVTAQKRNIQVSYTPDGPSAAVAELTVGLMIDLLRGLCFADRSIRQNIWQRKAGGRLALSKVGIIGCGRIGQKVINHLYHGFPGIKIYANDVKKIDGLDAFVTWADKEQIYRECDIISLHVPLTPQTKGLISDNEIAQMAKDVLLINTARGGIIDETALYLALKNDKISGAAIDVFDEEPYQGNLRSLENIVLTCHLGSMTRDCRANMELDATKEAIRFAQNAPLLSLVPQEEYLLAESLQ